MRIEQLHQLFLKSKGVSTDTRKITKDVLFFALKGDNFNGNEFALEALKTGASYAVVDDKKFGSEKSMILVDDVLETLQELATFHRHYLKVPIIALTGSNGKTTTKELIHVVLAKKYNTAATKGNLNNHIGVPLTLLAMSKQTEIGIVEMGANHLKEIESLCHIAQPDYGYITNFGKAHLEGFGGVEGVIKGKSELYDYLLKEKKYVFLNADDRIQKEKLESYIKKFGFSQNNNDFYRIELIDTDPFIKIAVDDVIICSNLIGTYNFTNIAAAILIGKYFNVALNDIKDAIEEYVPTNNRSQIISKGNSEIILDAYNANPSSMSVALENFDRRSAKEKIVVLGDMFELGKESANEHQTIVDLLEQLRFDQVYLIGENFHSTKSKAKNVHFYRSFEDFKNDIQAADLQKSTILIKGSRGMALERVLELI